MNNPLHTKLAMAATLIGVLLLPACSTMDAIWSSNEAPLNVAGSSSQPSSFKGAGISVAWRTDLDQRIAASAPGFSLPGVYNSGGSQLIVAGTQDKRVRVYSENGAEQKRIALDASCESGMLQLPNGLMVVGDIDGGLYGLDLEQESRRWKVELSSSLIGKPVAVDDGFIIQTDDNQLYRFTGDGKKLWSYSGSLGGLAMHLTPSPVVHQNRVYAALSNGEVVALKAESGSFVWKRQLLFDNEASVLSELSLPVATPTVIAAADSGRDEDILIVPVFQGELITISLFDGSTINSRQLSLKSEALLDGQQLFVADAAGSVSALSVADGQTLWKQNISSSELTGPVIWQNDLWVADEQGRIYRLNKDGKLKASIELPGRFDRTPVAASNGVLVRNDRGTLYLLH